MLRQVERNSRFPWLAGATLVALVSAAFGSGCVSDSGGPAADTADDGCASGATASSADDKNGANGCATGGDDLAGQAPREDGDDPAKDGALLYASALAPADPAMYGADAPLWGYAATISGTTAIFRAGQLFSELTWSGQVTITFLRVENGHLELVGRLSGERAAGGREVKIDVPSELLTGQVVYYFSYGRKVAPLGVQTLAFADSALFKLSSDAAPVTTYTTPEGISISNWARKQHPQGAIGDHSVFTEELDSPRLSSTHFMNETRYTMTPIRDARGQGLAFRVKLEFANPADRPPGASPSGVDSVIIAAEEGQEARAGDGSPRFAFSKRCERTADLEFECDLEDYWGYGQVLDLELRVVPTGALETNTYTPMMYYAVGEGFVGESSDPRSLLGGDETVDEFGANPSELAASFSQHRRGLSLPDVEAFLIGHREFRRPIGEAKQAGRSTCQSCHINDGRGDKAFDVPGVGLRVPPPLVGLGLLEKVVGRGDVGFGWTGERPTVQAAVEFAMEHDFGVSDPPRAQVEVLTRYSSSLAVPQRDKSKLADPDVVAGESLFLKAMQCGACHRGTLTTTDGQVIHPFTDMKRHTMADGAFRTPPLWGIGRAADVLAFSLDDAPAGFNEPRAALGRAQRQEIPANPDSVPYLHDGRAKGLDAAIRAHTGEGDAARAAYEAATPGEREQLLAFLRSL